MAYGSPVAESTGRIWKVSVSKGFVGVEVEISNVGDPEEGDADSVFQELVDLFDGLGNGWSVNSLTAMKKYTVHEDVTPTP